MEGLRQPSNTTEEAIKLFREMNSECLRHLRLIETDWPSSFHIMARLCDCLTDSLQVGSRPVAFRAMSYGLSLYGRTLGEDDPIRLSSFVRGVIDSVAKDLEYVAVYDPETESVWAPAACSFSEWLEESGRRSRIETLKVTKSRTSTEEISRFIFEEILDESQQLVVEEEFAWLMGVPGG